jgi:hypothetical protein
MMQSRYRFSLVRLPAAMSLLAMLITGLATPGPAAAAVDDALIFAALEQAIDEENPDLGPLSGVLPVPASEPALSVVGIGSRDFAVRVSCLLVAAAGDSPADCGIAFRRDAQGQSLLLTLTSDGSWTYGLTGDDPVQTGEATISGDAGNAAALELFAIGLTGYFGLNGSYLATIDLSPIASGGALAIGAGFAPNGARSSYELEYADLSIWSFDDAVASGAPPEDAPSAESQFDAALQSITANEPLAGPQEGLLIHTEGQATFSRTGVQAAGVVVHLECGPPSEGIELWDCGIVFRLGDAVDDQFRLILLSSGRWILARGTNTTIQDGFFQPQAGESGALLQVDLVAAGQTGWLGINGAFASPLDLSLLDKPGDVAAATAFFASTYVPGGSTTFQQFTVWEADPALIEPLLGPQPAGTPAPLDPARDSDARLFALLLGSITAAPPGFGPASGIMTHDPSAVTLVSSALDLENLAARLQCAAPPDAGSRLWDCGIVWRSTGSDARLRLAVVSDGFWSLRTGADEVLAEGSGLAIDNTPGSLLTIEVLVLGAQGFFAVNETFVSRLDLSAIPGSGDVLAGTAFFNESYADGGSTSYEQFSVWSIALQPEPAAAAATPSPVAATPAPDPAATPAAAASPASPATPDPFADVRALEPSNQARAVLEPVEGQDIHGYGVITRVARSIDISILIANAQPGDVVVLQAGTCAALSDDRQQMEPAGPLNAQGIIVTTLPLRLTEILNHSAYSMVVYAASDTAFTNPLSCGELAAE